MPIIAIANQKGGVGKTTTAVNLSAGIAGRGERVLLIDLDPQANATSALGLEPEDGESLYHALVEDRPLEDLQCSTSTENLSIIRSALELAGAEIELARQNNHLTRLREVLTPLAQRDDSLWIILDCPPSLGVLMTSALGSADELLIPLQCEYFGLEGLSKILRIVSQIQESGANPDIRLEGIVMTMFDGRTNLAQQVMAEVREHFPSTLYKSVIPRTIRLGEAPSFGQTIFQYDRGGMGAAAYRALADEFLERHAPVAVS